MQTGDYELFGNWPQKFEQICLVLHSAFFVALCRGELDVFKRLFDYVRNWDIVLQDVPQGTYISLQHAPPTKDVWRLGTVMTFVPAYEKSIRCAKSTLLASPHFDVRYEDPEYDNKNHDYPQHLLFARHCYIFPQELHPYKSVENLVSRLGQNSNTLLVSSVTTKPAPGNPNRLRLHPELVQIPDDAQRTPHGWPVAETPKYRYYAKLFSDRTVVPLPEPKETRFSTSRFVNKCLREVQKLPENDAKFLFRLLSNSNRASQVWMMKYQLSNTLKRLKHQRDDVEDHSQWLKALSSLEKLLAEEGEIFMWATWLIQIFTFGLKTSVPVSDQMRLVKINKQQKRRISVLSGRISTLNRKLKDRETVNNRLLAQLQNQN